MSQQSMCREQIRFELQWNYLKYYRVCSSTLFGRFRSGITRISIRIKLNNTA